MNKKQGRFLNTFYLIFVLWIFVTGSYLFRPKPKIVIKYNNNDKLNHHNYF
jgi:hypothetical protein